MSWKYNYHGYHRSYQRPYFYYSEKELDFTNEYLDYNQFLLQEFFNADLNTRRKISNYYIDKFGERSFAYLHRKFSEWANGDYHLTDLMSGRIIAMMPRFLNSEARHKLGIHQFMSTIKKTVRTFESKQRMRYNITKRISSTNELLDILQKEYAEIQSFSYDSLNIYSHKTDMLTDEELIEAIEISRYILVVKLQNIYNQIERDFQIFLPFIEKLKIGFFDKSFKIRAFNVVINLSKLDLSQIKVPNFIIPEIESNSAFRKYSDKYLAYELLSINRESKEQIADSFLNTNDLQIFINHYYDLLNYNSEVSIYSTFRGESGALGIKARLVPHKILITSLLYEFIKLTAYIVFTISLIVFAIKNGAYLLLLFGTFLVGMYAISLIHEKTKEVRALIKELKTHGKQQSAS